MTYNEVTQEVESQFLSLIGTFQNCAGGITPWQTWLKSGKDTDKDHGYVFEVSPYSKTLKTPKPIEAMGRFRHEAVAVDPKTSIVYLTEDRPDSLLYRFIPNTKEKLHDGGKLQVLSVIGQESLDTRNWNKQKVKLHHALPVKWLDIDNVPSLRDDLRYRGFDMGASQFARGEGIWFGENEIYFTCTNGGYNKSGQIFKYKLSKNEGEIKEVFNPGN